jgi:hypothetical protein
MDAVQRATGGREAKRGLDLVSSEYALATAQDAMRMWISAGYFRRER